MQPILTQTHPIFSLPRDRSRSYLKWGRRLAQAEGILLLLGSCGMLASAAATHQINGFAVGAAGIAVLWLALGWYLGRGSLVAAIILFGLTISRLAMVFVPGVSEFITSLPWIVLDLFVFTQATRGAIALTQPIIARPVAAPVVARPSRVPPSASRVMGEGFKWPVDWVESPTTSSATSFWADAFHDLRRKTSPNFTVDFIVASSLVAVSMAWFNVGARVDTSGAGGLAALVDFVFALFHLILATVLFAAAHNAEKGKAWARGLRGFGYGMLLVEALFWIRIISA
jgi:hypothetical protein